MQNRSFSHIHHYTTWSDNFLAITNNNKKHLTLSVELNQEIAIQSRSKKYEISWTKWSKNTKSDNNRSSLIRYWTWTLALIHTMSMSPLLSFTCVGAWQNTSNSLHMHKPPHSLLYTPLTVVTVKIAVRHPQLGAAKQTIAHRDRLKTSMSKKCILHNIHQLSQLATHSRCALQSSGTTTSLSSSGRNWFKLNHRTVL